MTKETPYTPLLVNKRLICKNTIHVGKNMVNGKLVSDDEFKQACVKLQQQQMEEERNER